MQEVRGSIPGRGTTDFCTPILFVYIISCIYKTIFPVYIKQYSCNTVFNVPALARAHDVTFCQNMTSQFVIGYSARLIEYSGVRSLRGIC